jgi:hypothetical protein
MNGMSTNDESARTRIDGLFKVALGVGILGVIAVGLGCSVDRTQFLQSYLFAYLFWLGVSLGCLAFGILHHLTGGRWGVRLKRVLEAGMNTLPLMALAFLPIWTNLETLYSWSRPGAMVGDEVLQKKAFWLNVPGWSVRAVLYFAIWILCAWFVSSRSKRRDVTGDAQADRGVRFLAGPMIIVYAVTVTAATVDWAMSLEPHWFSTMFGVIYIAGQGISAMAFGILVTAWLRRDARLGRLFTPAHFHDLGTLMFALTLFWMYVTFSQYLIIWSGNLAEETPWYLHRMGHGWQNVAISLVALGFFLPFLLLMQRKLKAQAHLLVGVAVIVIVARFIDMYWQIEPAFHREGFVAPHWMDLAMPFAIGGIWVAFFAWLLRDRPVTNVQLEMIHAEAHAAHH